MGERILYVEDEAECREPLVAVLELEGHTVYGYAAAEEARHHLNDCDVDVAIIDVRLPGQSGDAFARELRKANPDVRIVFLTGNYDVEHLKNAVPDALCLSKPVDVDVLLALVEA